MQGAKDCYIGLYQFGISGTYMCQNCYKADSAIMHWNRFQHAIIKDTRAVKNGPRNVKTTLLQPLIDNLLYPTKAKGTKSKLDNRLLTLTTQ